MELASCGEGEEGVLYLTGGVARNSLLGRRATRHDVSNPIIHVGIQ